MTNTTLFGLANDYATANAQINAAVTAFNAWAASMVTNVFAQQAGGNVTYSPTTANFSGTPDATAAAPTIAQQEATIALWNTFGAAMVAADAAMILANAVTPNLSSTSTTAGDAATAKTDTSLIASTATTGLAAIFTNQTYTSATMQLSGTPNATASITEAHQATLIGIANTAGTALLAAQSAINADSLVLNDTGVYFSITQPYAFQNLAYGDVLVGNYDQAPGVNVIEVGFTPATTNSGELPASANAYWTRAEIEAALRNLSDYIINTYIPEASPDGNTTLIIQ